MCEKLFYVMMLCIIKLILYLRTLFCNELPSILRALIVRTIVFSEDAQHDVLIINEEEYDFNPNFRLYLVREIESVDGFNNEMLGGITAVNFGITPFHIRDARSLFALNTLPLVCTSTFCIAEVHKLPLNCTPVDFVRFKKCGSTEGIVLIHTSTTRNLFSCRWCHITTIVWNCCRRG